MPWQPRLRIFRTLNVDAEFVCLLVTLKDPKAQARITKTIKQIKVGQCRWNRSNRICEPYLRTVFANRFRYDNDFQLQVIDFIKFFEN